MKGAKRNWKLMAATSPRARQIFQYLPRLSQVIAHGLLDEHGSPGWNLREDLGDGAARHSHIKDGVCGRIADGLRERIIKARHAKLVRHHPGALAVDIKAARHRKASDLIGGIMRIVHDPAHSDADDGTRLAG